MYCTNCGKEIPDGAAFCENCGAPAKKPDRGPDQERSRGPGKEQGFVQGKNRQNAFVPRGQAPGKQAAGRPAPRKAQERPKWFIPLMLGLLAVASIAAGMFVASIFTSGSPDSQDPGTQLPTEELGDGTDADDGDDGEEGEEDEDDGELSAKDRVYAAKGTGGSNHTFASYDAAIDQGAKCIEQDVHMSASGTLYVHYDKSDVVPYFDADVERITPGILRLEDVFRKYKDEITYVVELKDNDRNAAWELADLAAECDVEKNLIVQSFYPGVLEEAHKELPDAPIMCLCDDDHTQNVTFDEALDLSCVDYVAVGFDDQKRMTQSNVDRAHDNGKKFTAWDVDSEEAIKEVIRMGVDSYFTKYPKRALKCEKHYRK